MVQHAGQPGRFKVLLANEQEGWHQTVRRLLEPQGVQTLSARSGREALELIESTPVHVAVLDAQMPQLGGMQVIRLMREMHRPEPGRLESGRIEPGAPDAGRVEVPTAILLANDLNSHLLREALAMHVFSVLSKPVDFNVLLDALARVLRRYHASRWPKGQ
jgi:CheY-like chemotaxis protein